MKTSKHILLTIAIGLFLSCKEETKEVAVAETNEPDTGYAIQPVDIQHVKVKDEFWLPIIERVQKKTIEYAIAKCQEEGRFDNFLIAGRITSYNVCYTKLLRGLAN